MKKFKTVKTQLLIFLLFLLSLTGCNSSEDFYPKEELSSNGINTVNLQYFKNIFSQYEELTYEDFAVRIAYRSGNFTVTLYGLDITGKALKAYTVQGDIMADIINGATDMDYNSPSIGYTYDFQLVKEEKRDILTGTRHMPANISEYNFNYYKRILTDAGYPELKFDYCCQSLYYGPFEIDGDMKSEILDILYGKIIPYSNSFELTQEKGIIHTKALD